MYDVEIKKANCMKIQELKTGKREKDENTINSTNIFLILKNSNYNYE